MADQDRFRSERFGRDDEFRRGDFEDGPRGPSMGGRGTGAGAGQSPSKFLDDLAKLATDAAGVAQGMRREAQNAFRSQAERMMGQLDMVSREEFEAMRDLAMNARAETKALAKRVEALEAKHGDTAAKPGTGTKDGPAKS